MHDITSRAQTQYRSRASIEDLFFETLEAYHDAVKAKESLAEELRKSSDEMKEERERSKKLGTEYRQLVDAMCAESTYAPATTDEAYRKLQDECSALKALNQGLMERLQKAESSASMVPKAEVEKLTRRVEVLKATIVEHGKKNSLLLSTVHSLREDMSKVLSYGRPLRRRLDNVIESLKDYQNISQALNEVAYRFRQRIHGDTQKAIDIKSDTVKINQTIQSGLLQSNALAHNQESLEMDEEDLPDETGQEDDLSGEPGQKSKFDNQIGNRSMEGGLEGDSLD
ncbi:MAG: hypothetical protein Q9209_001103 [Squamulea sp. 1 TL-2023]